MGTLLLPVLLAAALAAPPPGPSREQADRLYDSLALQEAADAYRGLIEAAPEDADLHIRLADCLVRTDRFVDGIEEARRAVELTGGSAPALAALAKGLYREGKFDAAQERLRDGLERDPDCAECLWALGRVQAVLGDQAGAATSFQRAAAIEPENPIYLRSLAGYVADREKQEELYRGYLELPAREEERVRKNVEAWLAVLEYAGDRPLKQVDLPDDGTEIALRSQGGMHYVDLRLGTRKARYLFDTGASGVTISARLRKKLKLEIIDSFTITGIGGRGTAETEMVLIDEMTIGGAVIRNVPAVVRDSIPGIDGLIGPTLFGGATVTIDPRNRLLRIDGRSGVGAGTGKSGEEEAVELPFLAIGGTPFVPIQVDGVPMNAMVDTGASQAVLSPFALEQVPGLEAMAPGLAPPAYQEIRGATGSTTDARVIRTARLEIAGKTYEMAAHIPDRARVLVSYDLTPFSHALETEVWAILGNPQLEDFILTIDWGRQVLRFSPSR